MLGFLSGLCGRPGGCWWAAGLGSRPQPDAVHAALTAATHLQAAVAVSYEETEARGGFSLASSPSKSSRSWAANRAPGSGTGLRSHCPRARPVRESWPRGAGHTGGKSPRGLAAGPCPSLPLGLCPQAGVPQRLLAAQPQGTQRGGAEPRPRNKSLSPRPLPSAKRVNFFKLHLLSYCLFSGSSSNFRCPPQIRRGSPVIPERSAIHLKLHHSPHKQAKAVSQASWPSPRLLPASGPEN